MTKFYASEPERRVVYAYADDIQAKNVEIGMLRAALKPFCEADWYADGFGKFDGKIAGTDLDRAKSICSSTGNREQGIVMTENTNYIERSRVREILIGQPDESLHITEVILAEVDTLPISVGADFTSAEVARLRSEVQQCSMELGVAAKLLLEKFPQTASLLDAAAKRAASAYQQQPDKGK